MSAMKDQATPVLTFDATEYDALKAVVQYLLENERTSYEECEGDSDKLRNHIWYQARILLNLINE